MTCGEVVVREASDDEVDTEGEKLGIGEVIGPDKEDTVLAGVYMVVGVLEAPKLEVRI